MVEVAPSVLSSWVRVLLDALEADGHDVGPLLRAARISEPMLRDPYARIPVADVSVLWHRAIALTYPSFGLRVPKHIRHTTFLALGYAVLASTTLGEALERIVRYCQVVTDSGMLKLELLHDDVVLSVIQSVPNLDGSEGFRDAVMATIVRTARALMGRSFAVRRVSLKRAPTLDLAPYEAFFGCVVERGAADSLYFDRRVLVQPLPSSNPELARHNDTAVHEYLARIGTGTIVDRTRAAIAEQTAREVSPELVARKLGMSLRSLQRSLREHGASYESLLRDVRCELACAYLREARYSVTEIAFVLGYDSHSAFARAFKRWTGKQPSEYQAAGRATG